MLALVPGLSLGQSFGVPEGSRFQPVITDRMLREAQEGRSGNSDKRLRKQKSVASAKPKMSRPAEGKAAPQVRTWTDDTGKHTVEASFVALEAEQVALKKTDGKEVTLPLSRLSKNDQEYAKAQARCQQIMEEFKEADQLEQTIKNLNYRIRNAASSSAKANLEKQLIEASGKYRELVDEREQPGRVRACTHRAMMNR
jgi:hypothetical protein